MKFRILAVLMLASRIAAADDAVDYVRDVKPILARHCFACHGGLKQESGLRLDTGALILRGGENGAAIQLGNPEASAMIDRVTATDAAERMPLDAEPLAAGEIVLLSRWIKQGAKFPADEKPQDDPRQHWSYQPPQRPAVPTVKNQAWPRNQIDAFISSAHEQRGLAPQPEASRSTWLRRAYLDLIGLPPARDQLLAFLADDSPDAAERVVDELLASPRYGERWGRHWMDVWRYSDWYGRRGSNEIRYSQYHIWRWRDWIVESLNEDKGYDRMIVEMLAGDEVAPEDPDVLRATGFLGRNWYKFDRNVWLFETVEQTSMGLMAMTMRCARCHDHKYDPISQQDYYQFRAFFEPHAFRIDPIEGEPDATKDGVARIYDAKPDDPTFVLRRGDDRSPDKEHPLAPAVPSVLGNAIAEIKPVALPLDAYAGIAELLAAEQKAINDAGAAIAKAKAALENSQRELAELKQKNIESTPDARGNVFLADDFSKERADTWRTIRGQWQYQDGHLSQTKVDYFASLVSLQDHPRDFKATVRYKSNAAGDFRSVGIFFDMIEERAAQAVYTSANDSRPSVQAFHRTGGGEVYPPQAIVPCGIQVGREIKLEIEVRQSLLKIYVDGELKLEYQLPMARQAGKFALWNHNGTTEFYEVRVESLGTSVEDAQRAVEVAKSAVEKSEQQKASAVEKLQTLKNRIADQRAGKPAQGAEVIPAKYPTTSTGRRLALANWLIDPRHPRTGRVAVNHIWLRHFGSAIVPSVDNFGVAGKPPSHPELLDWLSMELTANQWSMKRLHREIVTSNTYGQSSTAPPAGPASPQSIDPENQFLWRMNSRRMEAEVVRDSLIAVSSDLDLAMGGPELDETHGLTSGRRSLYFRTTPDNKMEMLDLFDLANPNQCYQRRASVVPQQALAMTNSALAMNQARRLADQLTGVAGESEERFVESAFQQVLGRGPTASEASACIQFIARHAQLLAGGSELTKFSVSGEKSIPPAKDARQRARENLIHVLFNHNDFVTIR